MDASNTQLSLNQWGDLPRAILPLVRYTVNFEALLYSNLRIGENLLIAQSRCLVRKFIVGEEYVWKPSWRRKVDIVTFEKQ